MPLEENIEVLMRTNVHVRLMNGIVNGKKYIITMNLTFFF